MIRDGTSMPDRSGELLDGRYRLDQRIATGGMGEVWRATDTVLRRAVAVKTLRADRSHDPQFKGRFQHEARAMAALHHPGIAEVYDFGQAPGDEAYLVMPFVNGQPLNRRIAERGRLSAAETMSVVAQVGRALQAAHEAGIVHRDVKPGNIIVQPDGNAVLVDFGIAHSTWSEPLTGEQEIVGTAHYLAPEQASKRAVGPAADVYALGAVAYQCLAGHPPFLGSTPVLVAMQHLRDEPPELPGDVPAPARAVVRIALAKEPAARFRSAAAMADAADAAAAPALTPTRADLPALTPTRAAVPALTPTWADLPALTPDRRGHRTLVALALVLLALSGAIAALLWSGPFGAEPGPPAQSTPASTAPASSHSAAPSPTRTSSASSSPSPSSPAPSTSATTTTTTTTPSRSPASTAASSGTTGTTGPTPSG